MKPSLRAFSGVGRNRHGGPARTERKNDREAVDAIEQFVQSHIGNGRFLVTLTGEHTGALGRFVRMPSGIRT